MKKKQEKDNILIYQAKSGAIELKGDTHKETIWASLNQIADLFGVQKSAISKHIKNIFETGELVKKATVSKMETVQKEGKREVVRIFREHPSVLLILGIVGLIITGSLYKFLKGRV